MQQMGVLLLVSCSNRTLGLHLVAQMHSSLRNHLLQEIVQARGFTWHLSETRIAIEQQKNEVSGSLI